MESCNIVQEREIKVNQEIVEKARWLDSCNQLWVTFENQLITIKLVASNGISEIDAKIYISFSLAIDKPPDTPTKQKKGSDVVV